MHAMRHATGATLLAHMCTSVYGNCRHSFPKRAAALEAGLMCASSPAHSQFAVVLTPWLCSTRLNVRFADCEVPKLAGQPQHMLTLTVNKKLSACFVT